MKTKYIRIPVDDVHKGFIINEEVVKHIWLTNDPAMVKLNMKNFKIKVPKPKHSLDLTASLNKYGSSVILSMRFYGVGKLSGMQVVVTDQASETDIEFLQHESLGFVKKWIKEALDLAKVKTKADLITISNLAS
jgi:hypothetical protein